MNHAYRLVFNRSLNAWVAVAETAKSHGKGGRAKAIAATVASAFALNVYALPTDGQVSAGSGTISTAGNTMTVTQTSQQLALNWQSFNIAAPETVNFVQPNSSAIALNRVLGSDPSAIYGKLNANGQVFLLNPNGILFGRSAQVNVGGLVASTLNLSDADFMARNYRFAGTAGKVKNEGSITAADGGYIALLGGQVSNQGTLVAKLGNVTLAAGTQTVLDFAGDGLINVQVSQGAVNALAENKQLIQADGGTVLLTAKAADRLIQAVVNNEGVIEARTVQNRSGTIKLIGDMEHGTVNVAGTLDASAPTTGNGGFIETSAAHVKVADSARVTTLAANGLTGSWLIDPFDFTIAASGGDMTGAAVNAALAGGNFSIMSTSGTAGTSGDINVNDAVSWSANKLTLNAQNNININSTMNATGSASLALEFGQGAVALNNTSNIITGVNGKVNLPASTTNFTTRQGSDGAVKNYTVITSLGLENSTTTTDLQGINGNLALNYALGGNIDATATSGWNGGAGFTTIGAFLSASYYSGTFDGLGHTISNLTITRGDAPFGVILPGGAIRNLGIVGASITDPSGVGLARENRGTISNCYFINAVTSLAYAGLVGNNLGLISNSYSTANVMNSAGPGGGLVGYNSGTIVDSYATGSVSAFYKVGGLVGQNYGTISNSYATGNVSGSDTVGGLVGLNSRLMGRGSINDSYATGSVGATASGTFNFGGLVGYSGGTISNSYASGSVNASTSYYVGGLVGSSGSGDISNNYATGNVSGGSYVGGLAGSAVNGINLYATGNVTGNTHVGGLIGELLGDIRSSYATGSVTGATNIGGLVGNSNGMLVDSYSAGSVTGTSNVGGLVGLNSGEFYDIVWDVNTSGMADGLGIGNNYGVPGVAGTPQYPMNVDGRILGFTTAQMRQTASYGSGWWWNATNAWVMYDGYTYPLLRSFMTPLTVSNGVKTYDGLTAGNSAFGLPASNIFGTLSYAGTASGAVNVGSYTVTGLGGLYSNQQGYIISYADGALTVNPKALSLAGSTAADKTYDGNTTASVTAGTLTGFVGSETVSVASSSGVFSDKDAGTNKTVTASHALADGTNGGMAANYSLANESLTASIAKKALTVTGSSAVDKTYDGTTAAVVTAGTLSGLVGTETVATSASGTFDTAAVGSNKPVTAHYTLADGANGGRAANYLLADEILAANIQPAPAAPPPERPASGVERVYPIVLAAVQQSVPTPVALVDNGGSSAGDPGRETTSNDLDGIAASAAGTTANFLPPGILKIINLGMRLPEGLNNED